MYIQFYHAQNNQWINEVGDKPVSVYNFFLFWSSLNQYTVNGGGGDFHFCSSWAYPQMHFFFPRRCISLMWQHVVSNNFNKNESLEIETKTLCSSLNKHERVKLLSFSGDVSRWFSGVYLDVRIYSNLYTIDWNVTSLV